MNNNIRANNNIPLALSGEGEVIYEIQTYLRALSSSGMNIPRVNLDGVYGSETREAVSRFQAEFGIPRTGEVDNITWDILYEQYQRALIAVGEGIPIYPWNERFEGYDIEPGEAGNTVYFIQIMLETLSYIYEDINIPITGVYDQATERAIRIFQEKCNLPITGNTDIFTWNSLAASYNRHIGSNM